MPRGCGCAGNSCGCLIVGGPGITVGGTGNGSDPYSISAVPQYVELGPYTLAGDIIDLTYSVTSDAIVEIDIEADVYLRMPDGAPVGTRIEVRLNQSSGADVTLLGNVFKPTDMTHPIPPATDPALNFLSMTKMDTLNWIARLTEASL